MNSDKKRSGYLKKKTHTKNLLLFQHLHTGGVCISFAPRHSLAGKMTLGGFFFLSEINSFLPIGLAFPAEGSADCGHALLL